MAQTYTAYDKLLCSDSSLFIAVKVNNILTPFEFQFPPRVKDDSRSGSWDLTGANLANEPTATYKGSGPRKISVEWYYIVDGGLWTARRIQTNVNMLRGYFRNSLQLNDQLLQGSNIPASAFANLVVIVKLWAMGGIDPATGAPTVEPMTFRIDSGSIKHGDTLVGQPPNVYPLRTDVAIQLATWPKIGDCQNGATQYQLVPGQVCMVPAWY